MKYVIFQVVNISTCENFYPEGNKCLYVCILLFIVCVINHSHKKSPSLEIWAVKLRFLLIYENMLKSIATARSECTVKHKNKASYNTDYIVPHLIDCFGDD